MTNLVITVDGAFGSQNMLGMLKGAYTDGQNVQPYIYNDWQLFPDGLTFDEGVDGLDGFIQTQAALYPSQNIVLLGMSFGSVMIGSWLKRYGPTSTISHSRLSCVLVGNSARKYGGFLKNTGVDLTPDATPYQVLDLKAQYDGWSDFPDRLTYPDSSWGSIDFNDVYNLLADLGVMAGQNAALGMNTVHPAYNQLDVTAEHFDYVEGNITYRCYTTYPAPLVRAKLLDLDFWLTSQASAMDNQLRPMIETYYNRPEGIPTITPLGGITSLDDSQAIWDGIQKRRKKAENARLKAPQIRLWDGDFTLRGELAGWRGVKYEFIENDTGTAELTLSLDHYLAKWIMSYQGRAKRNVIITIDKQGTRWSGLMDTYKIVNTKDNDRYLTVTFKHDYEQAKHIFVWANPFLVPEVQFPKLWVIFGPAKWCLLMTLLVNLLRLESSLWTLPDNPLDPKEYLDLDISTWRNVVTPFPLVLDNSNLTIVFARFQSLHDTWKKDLEDAQLTVDVRRYIAGEDEHPFAHLQGELGIDFVEQLFELIPIRNGACVWNIIDNSGWGTETAFGGSWITGFIRAVVNIASDGTTEGVDVFTGDPTYPGEYYSPNFLGTSPMAPWIVFQDGFWTGIESSEFTYFEATDTSFVTGGHSMPGVNEAISAGVNMAGDFLTSIINTLISDAGAVDVGGGFGGSVAVSIPSIDLPPLGGIMDALAKILYEDTFAAFMEIPTLRAAGLTLPLPGLEDVVTGLGDFHYFEGWGDGADRAFTLSALMAVRAKMWATRAHYAHTLKVSDAAPYQVGQNGQGHYFLGTRVGTTNQDYPVPFVIFAERVGKISYAWDKDGSKGWTIEVGYKEPVDPAFKALEWVRRINQSLGTLGIL